MNQYLIGGTVILLVVFGLASYGWVEHNRFLKTKAEYSEFIAKTEALAEKARTDNLKKEMEYAKKVADAVRARDITFAKLREYQSRARDSALPGSPQTAQRSGVVCWTTDRFNSGLRELEEILVRGQIAVEDRKTLLEAWPGYTQ